MNGFSDYHELFNLQDEEITESFFIPMLATGSKLDAVLRYSDNSECTQKRILKFVYSTICDLQSKRSTTKVQKLLKKLQFFLNIIAKKRYPTAYSEASFQIREAKFIQLLNENTMAGIKMLLEKWLSKHISSSFLESFIFKYARNDPSFVENVACLVENKFNDKNRADLLRQNMKF